MSAKSEKGDAEAWYPGSAILGLIDSIRLAPRVFLRPKWRTPENGERSWVSEHPRLSRLGDSVAAVADCKGGAWLILESDWYGFPDGPRWRLVSVKSGGHIRSVTGFTKLPRAWRLLLTPSDF